MCYWLVYHIIIWLGKTVYNINDGNWDPKFPVDISGISNPPYFSIIENLGNLEYYQNGWWYESHKKNSIGIFYINQNTINVQFWCGDDVNVLSIEDERNGTVNEEPFITAMKFPGKVHMSLVCADVDNFVDVLVQEQEDVRA